MSANVEPIKGAAIYRNGDEDGKPCVLMFADGFWNNIQNCRTPQSALEAADRWQIKENKAVAKEDARQKKLSKSSN